MPIVQYAIGETVRAIHGNVGLVTNLRDGWVWVRWRGADGAKGPEVPLCRAPSSLPTPAG